jgi:hypothetical protein
MFTVSIQRRPGYLLAMASGPADVDDNCAGIVFVADLLRRTGTPRLLFDITTLEPRLGKAGGLEVISTLYASLPPMERIAIVASPGMSHGLVLEVARHRDVPAREFVDASEADAWLRQ